MVFKNILQNPDHPVANDLNSLRHPSQDLSDLSMKYCHLKSLHLDHFDQLIVCWSKSFQNENKGARTLTYVHIRKNMYHYANHIHKHVALIQSQEKNAAVKLKCGLVVSCATSGVRKMPFTSLNHSYNPRDSAQGDVQIFTWLVRHPHSHGLPRFLADRMSTALELSPCSWIKQNHNWLQPTALTTCKTMQKHFKIIRIPIYNM